MFYFSYFPNQKNNTITKFRNLFSICACLFALNSSMAEATFPTPASNHFVTMCSQGNQLGGQLLGYAVVLGYAWTHGLQPYFSLENLQKIPGGALNYHYIFHRLPQTLSPTTDLSPPVHTTQHAFDFPIPNIGKNLCICGEPPYPLRYFNHFRQEIREIFAPPQEIVEEIQQKYAFILDHPKTVAVHVRGYHPATVPHRCLGREYFMGAINRFSNDHLFVIFSDRIDWCKANLDLKDRNAIFIEGNNHVIDFYLMSFCKNIVISNSTYSWWAAYLKKDAEGLILVPEIWFSFETPAQRKTFYPDHYTTIPVTIPAQPDWTLLNYTSQSIGDI